MGRKSDDLCMCGHLFGHHAFEGHGDQGFTGRCAIGMPDWVMMPGTFQQEPILIDGKPIPNPRRCGCTRFRPGTMQIIPTEEVS